MAKCPRALKPRSSAKRLRLWPQLRPPPLRNPPHPPNLPHPPNPQRNQTRLRNPHPPPNRKLSRQAPRLGQKPRPLLNLLPSKLPPPNLHPPNPHLHIGHAIAKALLGNAPKGKAGLHGDGHRRG